MGLDNYWLLPKQTEDNIIAFNKAYRHHQPEFDYDLPEGVEFETAQFQGDIEIDLVGGIFSGNGNGSFRGKYYSAMCDALLEEEDWLYRFHYENEIVEAFEMMKPYLEKFLSPAAQKHWQEFVSYGKDNILDDFHCFEAYTIEDAIGFIRMFEYYSTLENICLNHWS
jgi:hypothetical protein